MVAACVCGSYRNSSTLPEPYQGHLKTPVEKEKNDLDHDVFFREGFLNSGNTKQVTYTPRLVSVDLKGALGKP